MNYQECGDSLSEIKEALRNGNKVYAIKIFRETFHCSLKDAKKAVDQIQQNGNYSMDSFKYDQKQYNQPESRPRKEGTWVGWFVLFILFLVGGSLLFFLTDTFFPQSRYYDVAVELEGGELLQLNFSGGRGAVNKKGEFLIDYNAKRVLRYISVYLDPYYDCREEDVEVFDAPGWVIEAADNPYYAGTLSIPTTNTERYGTTEMIYDSLNKYHEEDTYYNQEGDAVWEHHSEKKKGDFFQPVIETSSFRGATSSDFERYFNVNQFLKQKYGIDVQIRWDKKNNMVIFQVPKTAVVLQEEDVEKFEVIKEQ